MTPSQLILIAFVLTSVRPDETIRNYGMGAQTWQVTTLHGAPFDAQATLRFTGRYQLAGTAPCNSFRTSMEIPFPWFRTGPIAATKRTCPDLVTEQAFLAALQATTIATIEGDKLVLSDDTTALITLQPAD